MADPMSPKFTNRVHQLLGRPGARRGIAVAFFAVAVVGLFSATEPEPAPPPAAGQGKPTIEKLDGGLIAVAQPPLSSDVFPCSQCHAETDVVNRTRRTVDFHDDVHFDHDAEHRWCLDCHDAQHRDKLRLADGSLLDFTQSYLLCAQCHGTKFRDWKAGEHGRRTGSWSGQKVYLLCVHCHDPHSPKFKPIHPMPPPQRQEDMR